MGLSAAKWLARRACGLYPGHYYNLARWDRDREGRPQAQWPAIRCVRCSHLIWEPNLGVSP